MILVLGGMYGRLCVRHQIVIHPLLLVLLKRTDIEKTLSHGLSHMIRVWARTTMVLGKSRAIVIKDTTCIALLVAVKVRAMVT